MRAIEIRGIVKVSKLEENDSFREKYWTETIDISAQNEDGRKFFQSFHMIAVPEGQSEDFKRLRKQMRESLVSEFGESMRSLRDDRSPRKRIL